LEYFIGVDEAGRGPVLGDMVISGVLVTPRVLEKLAGGGLKDSKKLKPSKRRSLYYEALKQGAVVVAVFVPPWRIDRENLNDIEERYIVWALSIMGLLLGRDGYRVHVHVDEVKGRGHAMVSKARGYFKGTVVEFKVERGADSKYSSVMLASVFAKVMRDLNLLGLKKRFGDFGSGYPVDPVTKKWILENRGLYATPPLFVRRSWSVLKSTAPNWYKKKTPPRQKTLLDFLGRGV